jgi:hypothetical protein
VKVKCDRAGGEVCNRCPHKKPHSASPTPKVNCRREMYCARRFGMCRCREIPATKGKMVKGGRG